MRNFLVVLFLLAFPCHAETIEIALSFDDLPYIQPDSSKERSNLVLIQKIISVLAKHKVNAVAGFANMQRTQTKEGTEILDLWLAAGHLLANHTWSHKSLNNISGAEFIKEIDRNAKALSAFESKQIKYFRYPYLHEGNTAEKRNSVRDYLFRKRYRIAQVTLDSNDWKWHNPTLRCAKKEGGTKLNWLSKAFLMEVGAQFNMSKTLSNLLFGRQIKQIALFHPNPMTADQLDAVLTLWKKMGAVFISLAEALQDPVYQIDTKVVRDEPDNLFEQLLRLKNLSYPRAVERANRNSEVLSQMLQNACI